MTQRKKFLSTFRVSGRGEFPLDMLRYDSCWPFQPADVSKLSGSSRREVTMETSQINSPTEKRWESFGWKVMP